MFAARAFSFLALLLLFNLLGLMDTRARAQTSINDVHITPRPSPSLSVEPYTGIDATAELARTGMIRTSMIRSSMIRTSVDLVMVPVSITDGLNRPVVGLDQDNFEIFENKKPQQIRNFSSEDVPVSIGIILDVSGSMGEKLDRAREAVAHFCDVANPQDEFFMITFSDQPQLATDFTTKPEEIGNSLLAARSKGLTSLLDAIYMALEKMKYAHYSRKALLILSDGGDNHSRYTEHDVGAAVKEADVTIFAVGTYDRYVRTQEELLGPELLRSLTEASGGIAFTLNNPADMPAVTRKIGVQLRHQYVLGYQPQSPPRDGKWHKISVKLRLPSKFSLLHISARKGYYAGEHH